MPPELAIHQKLYQTLVEQTRDAVFILSVEADGNADNLVLRYVNEAYQNRFNLAANDIIGKEIGAFIPAYTIQDIRKRFEACLQQPNGITYEEHLRIGNNELYVMSEAFVVRNAAGTPQYIVGISKDVSELQTQKQLLAESKNMLQSIINSTDNTIVLLRPDYTIEYVNNAAQAHIYRLTGRFYHIGDDIRNYFNEPARSIGIAHVEQMAASGEVVNYEHKLTYPDGGSVWFSRRYYPAYDTKGSYVGFVIAASNITSQKEHELKIQQQNAALREIAKIQSHEIRRPLANILGLVQVLELEGKHKDVPEDLWALLKESTHELDGMIRQVVNKAHNL